MVLCGVSMGFVGFRLTGRLSPVLGTTSRATVVTGRPERRRRRPEERGKSPDWDRTTVLPRPGTEDVLGTRGPG